MKKGKVLWKYSESRWLLLVSCFVVDRTSIRWVSFIMKLYLLKKIVQIVQKILISQFRCLYWVWPDLRILILELISIYRSLSQNGLFPFVSRYSHLFPDKLYTFQFLMNSTLLLSENYFSLWGKTDSCLFCYEIIFFCNRFLYVQFW